MKNKRYKTMVKILYYIFGSFTFIAFASYLIKLLIWREPALSYIIAITGCIVTFIPIVFRHLLVKIIPECVFRVLETIFAFGTLIYAVTFASLVIYIYVGKFNETPVNEIKDDSVIIVFGAGLNGEKPTRTLRQRLDKTIEILNTKKSAVCVVTGGQGPDETISEAQAMYNYLTDKGISPDRIYLEDKAENTIENISLSVNIVEENNLNKDNIVCLSNAFHMPRIKLLCSRLSIESDFVFADNSSPFWLFSALVREYMAYAKLLIFGVE